MKKNTQYALVAISLIAFVAIGQYMGWWSQLAGSFSTGGNNKPPITDLDRENYKKGIGRYNIYSTVVDSNAPATALTLGTNLDCTWWTLRGGTWVYHATYTGTSTSTYINTVTEDGGIAWVVLEPKSGQNYYMDYQKTVQQYGYIKGYSYTDVDNDGTKEFAFQYDLKNHEIPNSGYPSVSFNGYALAYDTSFTGLDNEGNIATVGTTGATKKYAPYYLSFSAQSKGIAIYKVEFKINTTDETKIRLYKLEIPGLGYLDASSFVYDNTGSELKFTYTISTCFDNALYLRLGATAQNRFDSTLGVECSFTDVSTDFYLLTTTYYYLKAITETGGTTSDTLVISAK